MRAKRVLVTGGAGFISSNLVRHLLASTPYEVVSLDALTYAGNLENLADVMGHERLSFVHGDIRDAELVREVVAEVDVIVNAAAESHVEKSIEEGASEFVTTNVEGTQILLDAIREAPVERFILISSSEVYGTAEYAPMDEEHPLNPRSPYAATKAGGDRLAYRYFVTYGLPIVIVRPFNNYGPRQHPEKVVPRFVTQALAGEPLTIHGDGHASRDWLYVDDDAEAIEAIIGRADRRDRRRGAERRDRRGHLGVATSPTLVLDAVGNPRVATTTSRSGPARSTGTSARPTRSSGWPAGARARRSRTGSSARSRGIARTRPGGGRSSVAPSASPRPRRRRRRSSGCCGRPATPASTTIAVDRDPAAPGFASRRRAMVSTEDEAGVERLARAERGRRADLARADWPVGVAARVAERLGLPHPIDGATAVLVTDEAASARATGRGGRRRSRSHASSPRSRTACRCRAWSRRPTGRDSAG